MSGWESPKPITFSVKVKQNTAYYDPEVIEISEDADYFDDDELSPSERVVKVTVQFPENFFKPVVHATTLAVSPLAPTGALSGYATEAATAVPEDKHAAFEEDADEVVRDGDGKALWWRKT